MSQFRKQAVRSEGHFNRSTRVGCWQVKKYGTSNKLQQIPGPKLLEKIDHLLGNFRRWTSISVHQIRNDRLETLLSCAKDDNGMRSRIQNESSFRIKQNWFTGDFVHLDSGAR